MHKFKKIVLVFLTLGSALSYPYGDTDVSIKTKHLSNRLQLQQKLVCPTALYDSELNNSWYVSKFNGIGYEGVGSATGDGYDLDVWNQQGGNNVQLFNTPELVVSVDYFDGLGTYNTRDYLEPNELSKRVCVKMACPTGFEEYPSTVENKKDYCKSTTNRPKVALPIPKKMYLVYPASGMNNKYEVPDLGLYFMENSTTEYEVTGFESEVMDVSVVKDLSGKNKLVIETKKNDILDQKFKAQDEYTTMFKFMVKEKMSGFENKVGMELTINVVILSSVYEPKVQEVYRCQPLANN